MKLMPQGDYYAWDCDWCDSHNRTLWTRIDEGKIVCAVCYSKFPLPSVATAGSSINMPVER
jgi:hypothetical protein